MVKSLKRVEDLVDRSLANGELTKDELMVKMLLVCADSKKAEEEIIMRKVEKVEDIRETISLIDKIEVREPINAVKSYAGAVRRDNIVDRRRNYEKTTERSEPVCWICQKSGHTKRECPKNNHVECWTCHRKGHLSRNCPDKKPLKCFGCGKVGHVRRTCTEIVCGRCSRPGHRAEECYTNLIRRKQEIRSNNFKGEQQRKDWSRNKHVHAIRVEDDEESEEIFSESVTEDVELRSKYPKGRAPSVEELVGAIH